MSYRLIHADEFAKALRKLDRQVQRRILAKLIALTDLEDPTVPCKPLTGPLTGLWRLRAGDWRVILDIRRGELVIVALDVDHRSKIYES